MKKLNLVIKYRWSGIASGRSKNFHEFEQAALIHKSGPAESAICYDVTNDREEKFVDFKSLPDKTVLDFVKENMKLRNECKYFKVTFADHTSVIVQSIEELEAYMATLD